MSIIFVRIVEDDMGLTATAYLECDNCGLTETADLEPSDSPEDAVDIVGWQWTGKLLMDKLVCTNCAEAIKE